MKQVIMNLSDKTSQELVMVERERLQAERI